MNNLKNFLFIVLIPLIILLLYTICLLDKSLAIKLGGITNITSILIVLLTYIYVVLTARIIRNMIEIQNLERRPYILIDFEMIEKEAFIVLKNTGKLPALELKINMTPDIKTIIDENLCEALFSKPISFYPPGKLFKSFVNFTEDILTANQPTEFNFCLEYTWDGNKKPVTEKYSVNLDHHKKCTVIRNTKKDPIVEISEKIEKHLANLVVVLNKNIDLTNK